MKSQRGGPRRRTVNADQKKLTRDDWIEAGLSELALHGHQALKIQGLCKRLKVTKGSFYHHFGNITEFHQALLDYWRRDLDGTAPAGLKASDQPLQALARTVKHRDLPVYDFAIREWAKTNALAARALSMQDRFRHQRMKELYVAQGFDEAEADHRAQIFQWAWIGSAGQQPARREKVLGLLFELLATSQASPGA